MPNRLENTRKIGRACNRKEYSQPIINWLQGKGSAPQKIVVRAGKKRGRIYLGNIRGLGSFEITRGIKPGQKYELSFRDELESGHTNKIIDVKATGAGAAVPYYLKRAGTFYPSARTIATILTDQFQKWIAGSGTPPEAVSLTSDSQSRIFVSTIGQKMYIVRQKIKPGQEYNLAFREEKDMFRGKEILNLCVDVKEINGTPVGSYYFRFRGRSYRTARIKERAQKDFAPKRLTKTQKTKIISRAVCDFVEGRTNNPGRLFSRIRADGSLYLTTLSDRTFVQLRGLGEGERPASLLIEEKENGDLQVKVFERNGLLNNYYNFRVAGEIISYPSPELGGHNEFRPEVAQIQEWLGLDRNGRLTKPMRPIDLEQGLKEAPVFSDPFQAAWWLHRLRILSGADVGLGFMVFRAWLEGKINRTDLFGYSLQAEALEVYLRSVPEEQCLPEYGSYQPFFERVAAQLKDRNLVTFITAMFIGGSLPQRRKVIHFSQLAQAFSIALENPWLRQAPDFCDDFGAAILYIAKHKTAQQHPRLLLLALVTLDKLQSNNLRLEIIAAKELVRQGAVFARELAKPGMTREKFDRALLVGSRGKPYHPNLREKVLDHLFVTLAQESDAKADLAVLKNLAAVPKPSRNKPEAKLYALAKETTEFKDPFSAVEWALNNRIEEYSLGAHLRYLAYCKKLPDYCPEYDYLAGAFDYALAHIEMIVADIKLTIASVSNERYPTPFVIAKRIFNEGKWRRRDRAKGVGKNFAYLVVIAAFRLKRNELASYVQTQIPGRYLEKTVTKLIAQIDRKPEELQEALLEIIAQKRETPWMRLEEIETNFLVERAQYGDRQAQDYLVYFFEPLIRRFAGRYARGKVSFDDLMQIGRMKIIEIAKRFDFNRGVKFITYCSANLSWYIFTAASTTTGLIYKPEYLLVERRAINKIELKLAQELGRPPNTEELAEVTGMEIEELQLRRQLNFQGATRSINSPIGDDGRRTLEDRLPDERAGTEPLVLAMDLREKLEMAINKSGLTAREKEVLTMRYLGVDMVTLKDIGDNFNLTRERIRQIESRALQKLKNGPWAHTLKELYFID